MVYNCLLVGEADFSFTHSLILGLSKLLKSTHETNKKMNYSIISTCFDSNEITFNKYQDCNMRIDNINKIANTSINNSINVNICYNVDVLKNLNYLKNKLSEKNENENGKFDEIIFNFPHIGTECVYRNSSLLGHFVYQAKQILNITSTTTPTTTNNSNNHGYICISLTSEQYIRWKLDDQMKRHGFIRMKEIEMNEHSWPEYKMRRHHTGKSFSTRVNDCYMYLYKYNSNVNSNVTVNVNDGVDGSIDNDGIVIAYQALKGHSLIVANYDNNNNNINNDDDDDNNNNNERNSKDTSPKSITINDTVKSSFSVLNNNKNNDNNNNNNNNTDEMQIKIPRLKKKKARKLSTIESATLGRYSEVKVEDSQNEWKCHDCNKRFKTAEGAAGHVYNVHIHTNNNGNSTNNISTSNVSIDIEYQSEFKCDICQRQFGTAYAASEHRRAKHDGYYGDADLKPAWHTPHTTNTTVTDSASSTFNASHVNDNVKETDYNGINKNYNVNVNEDNIFERKEKEKEKDDNNNNDSDDEDDENEQWRCIACGVNLHKHYCEQLLISKTERETEREQELPPTQETTNALYDKLMKVHLQDLKAREPVVIYCPYAGCTKKFTENRAVRQHINMKHS